MCCKCCTAKQQKIWVFTIGSLLTIIGIVLISAFPSIADSIIQERLVLTPKSYTFKKWQTTPIDLYMTFYLFNWTNSHEVNNPNVKPHFTEHGPYTFRDFKVKEDLVWNDENSTVTFYGRRTWNFSPERSNGSLDDIIITPHFPTIAASTLTRNFRKVLRKVLNFALNREGGELIIKATAIDWIFNGFYDDLIDFVERLHSPKFPVNSNKFGWFFERNNSKEAEGTYTIHTGKKDLSQMGDLMLWNGSDHTGYWEGECGKVNGSTGELWSPYKKWDETISIFIMDAARYINLFPKEKVMHRGVEAWRYESTDQTFDSGYVAPDTKCFCVKGRECPKNGVIDFSPVAFRAPIYLSHPHFYMTDKSYLENTTGLNPDPEKHGIHAVIEPTLGIPMDINGQVMISVFVEKADDIDILKDVAHSFYAPLFHIQIKAEITDDLLDFTKFILGLPSLGQYIGIGLTVVGVIILAVGVWLTVANKWRQDDLKNNYQMDEEIKKETEENNENKTESPEKVIEIKDTQSNDSKDDKITVVPEIHSNDLDNPTTSTTKDLKE